MFVHVSGKITRINIERVRVSESECVCLREKEKKIEEFLKEKQASFIYKQIIIFFWHGKIVHFKRN